MRASLPNEELNPDAIRIVRTIAGEYADRYIKDSWLPQLQTACRVFEPDIEQVREAFVTPYRSLYVFFDRYAFARRGKDRDELSNMATLALKRAYGEEGILDLLKAEDGVKLWETFSEVCVERKRKNNEQLNRGLIQGMAELAQEIYRMDEVGSISGWIENSVLAGERLEDQFLRIVDIRGVGPKTTSTFLRDVIFLLDLEEPLDNADRLFVQPIDRWIRLFAEVIVPDTDISTAVDWIIAGKVSKYARRAGVSGIRFNMGATHFGMREVRIPENFDHVLSSVFPQ